jgi:hypothetical protein
LSLAGDFELVVGEDSGVLHYMENTGTSTAPAFVQRTGSANLFDGIDVGSLSNPALGDIDGDGTLRPCLSIDKLRPHVFVSRAGDLDLVVGDWEGELGYVENTGTSTAPAFVQRAGSANPFDGIDVGKDSAPAVADFDGDGTLRPRPSNDKL